MLLRVYKGGYGRGEGGGFEWDWEDCEGEVGI